MFLWIVTKKLCLWSFYILVSLIIGGIIYQYISTRLYERAYPAPGKMVDIGGYRLHINCTGDNNGGPTVILEAGTGCSSTDWALVQPEIAKFAKVCSYDRAGYGWSESSPKERTSRNIVEELHTLLNNAQVPKPYIIVGHSFGGLNARLYASMYPDEVAGVILVDSGHEDQFAKIPSSLTSSKVNLSLMVFMFMTYTGINRLLMHLPQMQKQFEKLPENYRKILSSQRSSVKNLKTTLQEGFKAKESCLQLKEAGGFLGTKPLIVISAGKFPTKDEMGISQENCDELCNALKTLQQALLSKSSNVKQIIATNSGHMIPLEQPDIIVEAVSEMLQKIST